MTFIPNEGDAPLDGEQAELDSVDITIILDGFRLRGVKSGCAVTPSSPTAMSAEVAAGVISFDDGTDISVAGGTVNFAAASSHMRFDLVVADSAGAVSVLDGAAFYSTTYGPTFPTYSNKVVLAVVTIPANTTVIDADNITDKRVMLNFPAAGVTDHGALLGLSDDDHAQYHNDARALTWLGTRSTSDLAEGTNLYYTAERVMDVVGGLLVDSSTINVTYNDGLDTLSIEVIASGVDHGGLAGLSDDDHAQYALLAGRSGGQTLRGGTGSGETLTIQATAHATQGMLTVRGSTIAIEPTGLTGGNFLLSAVSNLPAITFDSGDFLYYDRANDKYIAAIGSASKLEVDGGLRHVGYERVGSLTVPVNVTAGDLTTTRLMVGANTAFGTQAGGFGNFLHVAGTNTQTLTGAHVMSSYQFTHAPASAPAAGAQYRSLYYVNRITGDVDYSAMTQFTSGYFEGARLNVALSAGTFPSMQTLLLHGALLDSDGPGAALGTVPQLTIAQFTYTLRPSGTDTATLTDIIGLDFRSARLAGSGAWAHGNVRDIDIENPSSGITLNSHVGIWVRTLSRATNANLGAWFNDNRVMIGGDAPSDFGVEGQDGLSAISRLMYGLELAADELNTTNKYTAALKFVSTDSSFTTENPKLLGYIVGMALETYNADTRGGMALAFGATPNNPGATNIPVESFYVFSDGLREVGYGSFIGSSAAPTNTTAGDVSAKRLLVGTDAAIPAGVEAYVNGDLMITGNIGFYGTTPVARAAAYTPTNVTTDRSYDANATTVDELADVLGTLIADLKTYGLLQ